MVIELANRVAIVTLEKVHNSLAGAAWLQFPRSLAQIEDVTTIDLPAHFGSPDWQIPRAAFKVLVRSGVSPALALKRVPIRKKVELPPGNFDVIIVLCTSPFDLFALRWVEPLLARTKKVIAWMIEVWPQNMVDAKILAEPIELFDRLVVGNATGARLVQEILNSDKVDYIPPAADIELFAKFRVAGRRPILAMNVGRRAQTQHDVLMQLALAEGRHYAFDTVVAKGAIDPQEHHAAYAFAAGRSEMMVTNYCRFDQPEIIGNNRDLPARVFEGAAAGCLLAGAADHDALTAIGFDAEAVVPFGLDGNANVLLEVLSDPEAVHHYQRAALRSTLLCGDYAHRWQALLGSVGMEPSPGTHARIEQYADEAAKLL